MRETEQVGRNNAERRRNVAQAARTQCRQATAQNQCMRGTQLLEVKATRRRPGLFQLGEEVKELLDGTRLALQHPDEALEGLAGEGVARVELVFDAPHDGGNSLVDEGPQATLDGARVKLEEAARADVVDGAVNALAQVHPCLQLGLQSSDLIGEAPHRLVARVSGIAAGCGRSAAILSRGSPARRATLGRGRPCTTSSLRVWSGGWTVWLGVGRGGGSRSGGAASALGLLFGALLSRLGGGGGGARAFFFDLDKVTRGLEGSCVGERAEVRVEAFEEG